MFSSIAHIVVLFWKLYKEIFYTSFERCKLHTHTQNHQGVMSVLHGIVIVQYKCVCQLSTTIALTPFHIFHHITKKPYTFKNVSVTLICEMNSI